MNDFLKQLITLTEELNTSDGINAVIVVNEIELLYNSHIKELKKEAKTTTIQDIMETLSNYDVNTTLRYNKFKHQFYLDLETDAKSELWLFDDGTIVGRYQYQTNIDLTKPMNDIIIELCREFKNALHGRTYGQIGWFNLCKNVTC